MQTIIHLIRHGHHALLGRVLCGRMPGVALDETGRDELVACATRLEAPPSIIQSSPQLRARHQVESQRLRVAIRAAQRVP